MAPRLNGRALILYKAGLPPFDQSQENIIVGRLLADCLLGPHKKKDLT
jgi:hypothetical protein